MPPCTARSAPPGTRLVVGSALILVASRRSLVVTIATRVRHVRARVRHRFGRPLRDVEGCAGHELPSAMARMRADWRASTWLLGTAVLGKLLGCAGLYMVLTGLGIHLALPTILLVYTLTIMAAFVGPLPGGIGVADASLGALLVANGVSATAGRGAVIAFRLLDLWIPLLVGAVAGATSGTSASLRSLRWFRLQSRWWARRWWLAAVAD